MSMNAFEIRNAVLCQAQQILFEDWRNRQNVERTQADFEKRSPQAFSTPTVDEILALAAKLKAFVDGDSGTRF